VEVLLIGVVKPGLAKGDSEPDEVIWSNLWLPYVWNLSEHRSRDKNVGNAENVATNGKITTFGLITGE
jgi:hypothetical protein